MSPGWIIRHIRYRLCLSQQEFGNWLGIRREYLSRHENNKKFPSIKLAKKIIKIAHARKIKIKGKDLTLGMLVPIY